MKINRSSNYTIVIFFEAGHAGGSVNRLIQLLTGWNFEKYPVGVVTLFDQNKAKRLLGIRGISFSKTLGYFNVVLPDPITKFYGIFLPTFFAVKYFFHSVLILLRNKSAHVYLNNTPYSHLPVIVAAVLLKRRIICHLRDTVFFSNAERRLISKIDTFVALSQGAKKHYIEQGIEASKIIVIYDSINLDSFGFERDFDNEIGFLSKQKKVVVVGSLTHRKGQDICINALKRLIDRNINISMIFVGDGNFRKELEEVVTYYGLGGYVIFKGNIEDVPKLLYDCDIGVLMSRREGMPNSVMEYMAASLPVVVSDLPGIRELVQDKISGFVVDQESDEQLAERLMELTHNYATLKKMGKEGRRIILSNNYLPTTERKKIMAILFESFAK
jgi:glycosyltransferase involved in cell wall biosynthesis